MSRASTRMVMRPLSGPSSGLTFTGPSQGGNGEMSARSKRPSGRSRTNVQGAMAHALAMLIDDDGG